MAEEALMARAMPKTGYFSVYRDPDLGPLLLFDVGLYRYEPLRRTGLPQQRRHAAPLDVGRRRGLYGDDDLLIGPLVVTQNGNASPYYVGFYAQSGLYEDIHISWSGCVPSRALNEDVGGDDLYVSSIVVAGDGGVIRKLETPGCTATTETPRDRPVSSLRGRAGLRPNAQEAGQTRHGQCAPLLRPGTPRADALQGETYGKHLHGRRDHRRRHTGLRRVRPRPAPAKPLPPPAARRSRPPLGGARSRRQTAAKAGAGF